MTTLTTNIENDSSDGYDDTVPALVIDPNVSIVSDQIGVLTGVDAGGGAIEFDATAEIFNYGQIISFAGQGSYDAGVYVANGASLFNERSGSIEGYYGVYSPNDNGSVRNDGYIDGLEDGVRLAGGDASLINTGTITGTEYAVYDAFGGGLITNSGTIDGVLYAARADDVDNAGLWKDSRPSPSSTWSPPAMSSRTRTPVRSTAGSSLPPAPTRSRTPAASTARSPSPE